MWSYSIRFIFINLFTIFISLQAFSAITIQSSDIDYYIYDNSSFSLIFNESFLNNNKRDFFHIYKKISYYDDIYREVFQKKLKEKPIYIFASSRNQVSNAVTSNVPFLRVVFFPTGVDQMTHLATTSWEDTVIAHEMAHIFQLGQISNSLKYIQPIFRNSEVIFLPFPIFLNVNLVLPLFLLEGHAVLNESLFAPGGRLYSGSTRALVFSQIKHKFQTTDQFIRDYLINLTEDTFTVDQQYSHGGYFFNTLLEKYSIQTINNIFKKHAEHFIFPISFFSIKETFKTVFDNSFESLVNHYIQKYQPLAIQQNKSSEEVLFHSHICPPFNKKDNEIFFLTSDLKTTPILRSLNKSTGRWKKNKKIFSIGKVFKIKSQYYVTTSSKINTTERVYGLFSEGMYLEKHKSQSVQDMYKNQVLTIDTSNNMNGFHLKLNGSFYDVVNSPAIFGSTGDIYYFKQEKDQRVMYKNKSPIFQFRGFYGKPVEVDETGTVYFIAATQFGSSLFKWNTNESIYRISSSDVIIEAIKGPEGQFLTCEIEPDFYSYKLIHTKTIPEQPYFYQYSFQTVYESVSSLSTLADIKKEHSEKIIKENQETADRTYIENLKRIDKSNESDDSNISGEDIPQDKPAFHPLASSLGETDSHDISYSSYHSLRHIRFNGVELGVFNDPITGYNGLINIGLRDPLEYNAFHFTYQYSLENWLFQSKYINRIYRLSWDIQYIYKQGLENFSGSRAYSYIHEISQGFAFPLFKSGHWLMSLYMKNAISSVELKKAPSTAYYFSTEPTLRIQYTRAYNKNYDFHRQFFLQTSLHYHFRFYSDDSNFRLKTKSYYTVNWGSEFYTMPFFFYQTALKEKSIPFRYFRSLNIFKSAEFSFFARERIFEETNDYLLTGVKLKKFIETPLYFTRYPLSLRGLTPSLNGKYIYFLNNNKNEHKHLLEWTFGMEIALLIHHKVKAKINLYYGYSHPGDILFPKNPANAKEKIVRAQKLINTEPLESHSHFGINLKSEF